jgi:hypothetical protein
VESNDLKGKKKLNLESRRSNVRFSKLRYNYELYSKSCSSYLVEDVPTCRVHHSENFPTAKHWRGNYPLNMKLRSLSLNVKLERSSLVLPLEL